jgi:hypothetical protein
MDKKQTSEAPEAAASAPAPAAPAPAPGEDPGKVYGILSIVFGLLWFLSLVGLILGIIGHKKSKAAGHSTTVSTIGIVFSAIGLVIGLFVGLILIFSTAAIVQKCQELGPGTHYENGTTFTCS